MLIATTTLLALYYRYNSRWFKIEWLHQFFEADSPRSSQILFIHNDTEPVLIKKRQAEYNSKQEKYRKHNVWDIEFVIQLLMIAIIPIPGFDCYIQDGKSVHLLSELLMLCMFLRFYFILQTSLF